MNITEARAAEHAKYTRSYTKENYRMGAYRRQDAEHGLEGLPCRGSYLDVSCGRGEMLVHALTMGFDPVRGTEIVPELIDGDRVIRAEVHALPFDADSFDVVSMNDVIEHLIPGDDELACRELARVAQKHVLISACEKHSKNWCGDILHINIRKYEEWDSLFRKWFYPAKVMWAGNNNKVSQSWRVDITAP